MSTIEVKRNVTLSSLMTNHMFAMLSYNVPSLWVNRFRWNVMQNISLATDLYLNARVPDPFTRLFKLTVSKTEV